MTRRKIPGMGGAGDAGAGAAHAGKRVLRRLGGIACLVALAWTTAGVPLAHAYADGAAGAATADGPDDGFTSAYTAWPGNASTLTGSMLPGAVPVSSPPLETLLWSCDVTGARRDIDAMNDAARDEVAASGQSDELLSDRNSTPLVLRQVGQATYAYVVGHDAVYKLDASTGEELARADLGAAFPRDGQAAFVGSLLVVPTAQGGLVAFDEDLELAWESSALPGPAVGGAWDATSQIVGADGQIFIAFAAEGDVTPEYPDGSAEAVLASFADYDGSLLWTSASVQADGAGADGSGGASGDGAAAAQDAAAGSSSLGASDSDVPEGADATPLEDAGAAFLASLLATSDGIERFGVRPSLFLAGDDLLVSYGGAALALVDGQDGRLRSQVTLDAPVAGRLARVYGAGAGDDIFVAVTTGAAGANAGAGDAAADADERAASSNVYVLDVSGGAVGSSEPLSMGVHVRDVRPVVVGGIAYVACDASPSDTLLAGDAELTAIDLAASLEGIASIRASTDDEGTEGCFAAPSAPKVAGSVVTPEIAGGMLATVRSLPDEGSEAAIMYPGVDGSLVRVAFSPEEGVSAARVDSLRAAEVEQTALAASTPVANRDGTIFYQVGDALLALAPDADEAGPTVVGGSNGLDTIMGTLITLPNGAGLGAGVLVLGAAFVAYYAIRNRGNRAKIDEGVVAWREEHDGGDGSPSASNAEDSRGAGAGEDVGGHASQGLGRASARGGRKGRRP